MVAGISRLAASGRAGGQAVKRLVKTNRVAADGGGIFGGPACGHCVRTFTLENETTGFVTYRKCGKSSTN
jgi:hypothetical protein